MRKLKIAIVNKFFYLKGGSEKVMFDEAALLEDNGHKTAYFSMNHPKNPDDYKYSKYFIDYIELSNLGKEYSLLEKLNIVKNLIYNNRAAASFEQFIADFKPDIIHCHNISSQISPSILFVAQKYGIPTVMTIHDCQLVCPGYLLMLSGNKICNKKCLKGNYWNCVLNKCVKNSYSASLVSTLQMYFNKYTGSYTNYVNKFIFPSQFLMNLSVESGISEAKAIHIPNFTDSENVVPNNTNQGYFLYVGRLSVEKGLFTLLKAFRHLPGINLKIVGTGPIESELVKIKDNENLNNIEFLGYKTGEELKTIFKNCIALILPSECYENAPMTIIEAFAHGKPAIGSNIGGIPEMIEPKVTGLLFEAGNVLELAQEIAELNSNPDKVALMGLNSRKKAETVYSSKFHYEKLTELYNSLICPLKPARQPEQGVS